MRSKDLKPIIEQLLPDFPSFRLKGSLFFSEPVGDVLSGFCFDSSGWERWGFYLSTFNQPLYIPGKRISLSYGRRIGERGGWWAVNPEKKEAIVPQLAACMKEKGIPLLDKFDTPLKFANLVIHDFNKTVHQAEIVAYSFAFAGEREAALEWLDRVEASVKWERQTYEQFTKRAVTEGHTRKNLEMVENLKRKVGVSLIESLNRAQQLRRALGDSQESARQLLAEWRRCTLDALGLTKYAAETDAQNRTGKPSQR